jgi:hypothetical protein
MAMQVRNTKPWRRLDEDELRAVPVTTGVYELADEDGRVVDLGYAGALSQFGLRGAIAEAGEALDEAVAFRYEVHNQYISRFEEMLMVREFDDGALPAAVLARGIRSHGRLTPN